eukprot:4964092-Amphidinium_carterae.1
MGACNCMQCEVMGNTTCIDGLLTKEVSTASGAHGEITKDLPVVVKQPGGGSLRASSYPPHAQPQFSENTVRTITIT